MDLIAPHSRSKLDDDVWPILLSWQLDVDTSVCAVAAWLAIPQKGLATLRVSVNPVLGSLNSFQLMGYI